VITPGVIFWMFVFASTALAMFAVVLTRRDHRSQTRAGWVYFIGNGPDTPIKVGMTRTDPSKSRLTELRTMSPVPLRIYYTFFAKDRFAAEAKVHEHLADYRVRGEWFDRDATLALIDHMKGQDGGT
jgi:hypothetical protein